MRKLIQIYLILVIVLGMISCVDIVNDEKASPPKPNVILLIGDGMGLSALSSAFYYGDETSNFTRFSEIGLIKTSSKKHKITDSAAGATAFACGEKTYNGAVGVNIDSVDIKNITEVLSVKGYSTGVIATSSVTHATPAGFYAHVVNRGMEEDIAIQLVNSQIDFFAGGGIKFFQNRTDNVDLTKNLQEQGFVLNIDIDQQKPDLNNKYGFLLAEKGMPRMLDGRGDFLPDYTSYALDYFSQSENGFFLMVEGSQIDWAGHSNDSEYLITEMLDFDNTVGIVMDYAQKNKNTLVIVLADHETGGFALSPDNGDYSKIAPSFAAHGHSTTLIPVFAYGPGAESFKGIYENSDIYWKILDVIGK